MTCKPVCLCGADEPSYGWPCSHGGCQFRCPKTGKSCDCSISSSRSNGNKGEAKMKNQAEAIKVIPELAENQEEGTNKFYNASGLKFVDISSEAARTYEWGDGKVVKIENPLWLNVSKSGGHRVFDGQGTSHYISSGWIHLSWKVKQGQPNFVT